ncbi:hypothetical protein ACH5RR_025737 [Cinchona calisaya]|uniref:Uncharacterized protein n=1 Tax=Cinchona calisaya TaxID=153742 RepID=A0ABD2Z0I6_9GENT
MKHRRSKKVAVNYEVKLAREGVPCAHVAVVVLHGQLKIEDFVHPCNTIHTYAQTYSHMITPTLDNVKWVDDTSDPIMPPRKRVQPGRPKKLLKNAPDK